MALNNIAPADDIKWLRYEVRQPANEVHIVPGIKHNLLGMNQFAEANILQFLMETKSTFTMQQTPKSQFHEAQYWEDGGYKIKDCGELRSCRL